MPTPSGRFHCPERSGYLPKSTIWARTVGAREVAKAAVRAVTIRLRMLIPPLRCAVEKRLLVRRLPQFRGDAEGGVNGSLQVVGSDRLDVFWLLQGNG